MSEYKYTNTGTNSSPQKMLRVLAIDIGYKNFALSIDDIDRGILEELREEYAQLEPRYQKRVKSPTNPYIDDILKKLYLASKQVYMEVCDFEGSAKEKSLSIQTRKNLITYLDEHRSLWEECDDILVEQQYVKAGGSRFQANFRAVRLGEITLGWFLANYPDKRIVFFGSENKTQILGAPYSVKTKPQRKAWSCEKAKEIFTLCKETEVLQLYDLIDEYKGKRKMDPTKARALIESGKTPIRTSTPYIVKLAVDYLVTRQKMDDISDCKTMGKAYVFRVYVGMF